MEKHAANRAEGYANEKFDNQVEQLEAKRDKMSFRDYARGLHSNRIELEQNKRWIKEVPVGCPDNFQDDHKSLVEFGLEGCESGSRIFLPLHDQYHAHVYTVRYLLRQPDGGYKLMLEEPQLRAFNDDFTQAERLGPYRWRLRGQPQLVYDGLGYRFEMRKEE